MGKGKKDKPKKERRSKQQLAAELATATLERDAAVLKLTQMEKDSDERAKSLLPFVNFAARVRDEWCVPDCPGRRVVVFFLGNDTKQVDMMTTKEQWLALLK
ncbi:MAG TPA: hypothetical protein VM223_07535 [Planctomycetota bacterium]|nr:hypothetical protein [Planctomycetota bacterium]